MVSTALLLAARWFPVLAVAWLVVLFVWRRLWRELPFFFAYLTTVLFLVVVAYVAIRLGKRPYFYTFWISDLVAAAVAFLPMYEVFLRRLFKGFHRTQLYRGIFPIVTAVILLLAVLTALQAHDKGAAFKMASRAFDFARTAILVFFIGLMAFMGRQWTRYDLGITLGFAVQAAVALANAAVRVQMHYRPTVMDTVESVAYNLTCLIWLVTFWKPEKPPLLAPAELHPEMVQQARHWEEQLKDWITPRKGKR